MATTATQPQVVVTAASSNTPALGTLFVNLSFFLLQRVPSRSHYISRIRANGGAIVALETAADYIIADHLRRDSPPGSISYTFLDAALDSGALPDPAEHQAGPAPGTIRAVGEVGVPGKSTRTRFTHADDVILWEWVNGKKRVGGSEKGLEIYKQLEARHPQHTTQSWRDRWVKMLSGREKPAGAREVEELGAQVGEVPGPSEPRQQKTTGAVERDQPGSEKRRRITAPEQRQSPQAPESTQRVPFTEDDDRALLDWVKDRRRFGESIRGNKIYEALAEKNTRHTAQSWRDRCLRKFASEIEASTPAATKVTNRAGATPTKSRVAFTEEDDLILWNWVVTCKVQSDKCWVKGASLYKELAKMNARHPWRAWRERYLRVLCTRPPEGGLEESDVAHMSDEDDAFLTREQFIELFGHAEDIEAIAEDQIEDAWDAWAEAHTTHSAEVWRRLYESHVRPVYLKQPGVMTAHGIVVGQINEEGNLTDAQGRRLVSSPARSAGTPDRAADEGRSTSPGARKRKRTTPTSSRRRTYGRKRARGDGSDIFSEGESDQSPADAVTTPELLARRRARPYAISHHRDAADDIDEVVANGDRLPTSEANRAAEQQLLAHAHREDRHRETITMDHLPTSEANSAAEQLLFANGNRNERGQAVTDRDHLSTSEANHAAEAQIFAKSGVSSPNAAEDEMEVDEGSDGDQDADDVSESRNPPLHEATGPFEAAKLAKLVPSAAEELEAAGSVYSTSTAFERAAAFDLDGNGNILDKNAEARMYMSDSEYEQDVAESAAKSQKEAQPGDSASAQRRFDEEVLGYSHDKVEEIVPPPVRALTAANLADFESQAAQPQHRANDLAEDADNADQTNFASYLQSLLPVQPDADADEDIEIPDRLMDTPEEEEADAIELESDRELSPDGSEDDAPEATEVNIAEVFSQNLDWPSSPVKSRKVESSPLRQESQGWGFETQLQYPDLANAALEAAREEAEHIASQVADVITAPSPQRHRAEPTRQLGAATKSARSTTPTLESQPAVEAASPLSHHVLSNLATQPRKLGANAPHDWSREEDAAITQAMQRSSRAADILAELQLPGRSLPAIRRRSAILLQQRPSLMGGWDEDEDDDEDEIAESVPATSVPAYTADTSQASILRVEAIEEARSTAQAKGVALHDADSEMSGDDGEADASDDEIDLTIPEPEGGFDMFSSQQDLPLSSPHRNVAYPDLPDMAVADDQAEVMEISSASSSSDSSDDELEQVDPKPLPITQQSLHMLNTQAILDAESQELDLGMPLPPDSDDEDEDDTLIANDLPAATAVQVPASSLLTSSKPKTSSAPPIKSTPAPPPFPSSNSKPRSSLPFTKPATVASSAIPRSSLPISKPLVSSNRTSLTSKRPPIPADETLPSFLHRMSQLHYTQPAILSALHRTSMRFHLAQALLISEKYKRPLSDSDMRKGIWTAEEDRVVLSGNSGGLRRLAERFGDSETMRRLRFLEDWESA